MKEYEIVIIETLSKTVRVNAEDYDSALSKVEDMYNDGAIILGADDFKGKIIE